MAVQARIALDGGGVYAVEVEPDDLRAQLLNESSRYLEFQDPSGFTTLIPRDKVLMVQFGVGIPSPQAQEAQQQAHYQQMQQQYAQMQQQYQQMQAQMGGAGQPQESLGDRARAKLQQLQSQLTGAQGGYPGGQQYPAPQQYPAAQQYPTPQQYPSQQQYPGQQPGQNPLQW